MTIPLPPTVYIKWIESTHDSEDDFLMASEHPSTGAELYTLTPERNDMNEKLHYTDEEKIKRLSAWHEADKITLATRDARIAELAAMLFRLQEMIVMGEYYGIRRVYAVEGSKLVDEALLEARKMLCK